MTFSRRDAASATRSLLLAVGILLVIAGLACLAASALPYSVFKAAASRFAAGHAPKRITEHFYASFLLNLRGGGLLMLAAAALALLRRNRLAPELVDCAKSCVRETRRALLRWTRFTASQSMFHNAALGMVLLSALLIRGFYVNQPVRYDEAATYLAYARTPLIRSLTLDYTPNNHLLHTVLVHFLTAVAGSNPVVIRIPVFIFGFLAVAAWYYFIAWRHGSSAALLAAALIATNAELIMFSTNARGYMLLVALFPFQLLLSYRLAQLPKRKGLWVLFIMAFVAGLCTVPTDIYALAICLCIYALSVYRTGRFPLFAALRPAVVSTAIAATLTAVVYWPVILGSGFEALFENRFVRPETLSGFSSRFLGSVGETWNVWNAGWNIWFVAGIGAGTGIGLLRYAKVWRRADVAAFPVALLLCFAMASLQRVLPPTRVWLFLVPLYLGAAATGADFIFRALLKAKEALVTAFAILLLLISGAQTLSSGAVYSFSETGTNPDAARVAGVLAAALNQGDLVIATLPASYPVMFYLFRLGVSPNIWTLTGRQATRVVAVIDKTSPGDLAPANGRFSSGQQDKGLAEAARESYTGIDLSRFHLADRLYDSDLTEVVVLKKDN
jgi:hypothetical protein